MGEGWSEFDSYIYIHNVIHEINGVKSDTNKLWENKRFTFLTISVMEVILTIILNEMTWFFFWPKWNDLIWLDLKRLILFIFFPSKGEGVIWSWTVNQKS